MIPPGTRHRTQSEEAWVSRLRASMLSVAGLLAAVALVWVAARGVEWLRFREAITDVSLGPAIAGLVTLLAMYAVFAMRWRVFVPPSINLPFNMAFAALMIGYGVNTVIPARVGDIARAQVIARRTKGRFPVVIASIYAEHLFDAVFLVSVIGLVTVFVDLPRVVDSVVAVGIVLAALAVILILIIDPIERRVRGTFLLSGSGRLSRLLATCLEKLNSFRSGFTHLRSWRRLSVAGILTAAIWSLLFISGIFWGIAVGLSVPWYAIAIAIAVAGLGASIPGVPGAIGAYEVAVVTALAFWTDNKELSFAFAVLLHASQAILNIGIGGLFLAREGTLFARSVVRSPDGLKQRATDTNSH